MQDPATRAGAVGGIIPVFSYGIGRSLDFRWNEFFTHPAAGGPLIMEFDTPLDIRNLRVATTGCDGANHEPCSTPSSRPCTATRTPDVPSLPWRPR